MNFIDQIQWLLEAKEINFTTSVARLLLSFIFGGLVGLERRRKGQMAGFRTFALISMGSTLCMLVSIYISQLYAYESSTDPSRIAAQVLTGIGFLGAGAIIQTRGIVKGLTTAAGIWIVASIGLSIGCGMYLISLAATVLVLIILFFLDQYERRLVIERTSKFVIVEFGRLDITTEEIKTILHKLELKIHDFSVEQDFIKKKTIFRCEILFNNNSDFQKLFDELKQMDQVTNLKIDNMY